MAFFRRFAVWYDGHLMARPLTVKMLTSGLIVGSSDTTAQYLRWHKGHYTGKTAVWEWNVARSITVGGVYGACIFAPILHHVFLFWNRVMPSKHLVAVAFRTAVDMVTSFPINLSCMIATQTMVRHKFDCTPVHIQALGFWHSI
jgi:hypothetical protein